MPDKNGLIFQAGVPAKDLFYLFYLGSRLTAQPNTVLTCYWCTVASVPIVRPHRSIVLLWQPRQFQLFSEVEIKFQTIAGTKVRCTAWGLLYQDVKQQALLIIHLHFPGNRRAIQTFINSWKNVCTPALESDTMKQTHPPTPRLSVGFHSSHKPWHYLQWYCLLLQC